jgi:GntR family transcriptional regulator/MocR family aminotransferase
MLTYTFSAQNGIPLYEQLYRFIKAYITSGALKRGEKLPSKRALASHLHLAVITVQNAYAQLQVEGYIVSRERSGYFVARLEERLPPPNRPIPPAERREQRQDMLLDLRTNRISAEHFPFATWSRLMRQILSERSEHLLEALPPNGAEKLRKAIAEHLYRFRGMAVSPDSIVIAAGTDILYSLLIQLLGADQTYALEDPGYGRMGLICHAHGARALAIPLDCEGMDVAALTRSGAQAAHLSPAHHFPTGVVMPVSRRQELLRWAEETGGILLEDDYDSEFRLAGRPIETMQSIDSSGRVVYMNTFSKSIAPSIRISYMVLPDALMAQYREKLGFYACTVPSFEQYTLSRFISDGHFEKHLARMKNAYRTLRGQVIEVIDELPFRQKLTISEEHAGLHFLLKVDSALADAQLVARAAEVGVRIACLNDFAHVPDPKNARTLVVNYSGVTAAQLAAFRKKIPALF